MVSKKRMSRWLVGAVILAVAECAAVAAIGIALTDSAQAQLFGEDRYPSRQRSQRSGGFFDNLFGPSSRPVYEGEPAQQQQQQQPQQPSDNSRAPSPRKPDAKAEPVTTSIVVMGDGMADWLAYGLEDAFSDTPEIGILRKTKVHSGLLRYEPKGDLDWWHVARDILTQEKANYVVMMLGVGDRQNIREKDLAKEADKNKGKDQPDKSVADKSAQNKDSVPDKEPVDDPEQPAIVAPEPQPGKTANGIIEFRTDQWAQVYSRRIDETTAALKSKGVPVFWVGLPSLRGARSTADAVYLNDLFRARAERAGAIYIDVWDGFVDEGGKYSNFGPDYEGQVRRLRSSDGVYFTKYGARKLAHYVERELRRTMSNRALQVSLPAGPAGPVPADGKSAARPLAGPVVPLTMAPGNSEELLGGSGAGNAHGDAIAARVLVKGEPVPAAPGRADDFAWPRGSEANAAQPVATAPAAAAAASASAPPEASAYTEPQASPGKNPDGPKAGSPGKTTQNTVVKPRQQREAPRPTAPRPPQPVRPSAGPFGWLR